MRDHLLEIWHLAASLSSLSWSVLEPGQIRPDAAEKRLRGLSGNLVQKLNKVVASTQLRIGLIRIGNRPAGETCN
jgi:hypothetical protein